MMLVRRSLTAVAIAGAVTAGAALPASAASPVVTGGLVNVTIANVANNNQVQVAPIQAAAAICGVQVGVLSTALASGPVLCTPRNGNQTVTASR